MFELVLIVVVGAVIVTSLALYAVMEYRLRRTRDDLLLLDLYGSKALPYLSATKRKRLG